MTKHFNSMKCPHLQNICYSISDLTSVELKNVHCAKCDNTGPNLWICLHDGCLQVGCSEQVKDHSTEHFRINNKHSVHINLSSQRAWCYLCESEIFIPHRRSYLESNVIERSHTPELSADNAYIDSYGRQSEDSSSSGRSSRGLVGLQNIANTCYMNSALQALSNIPELTYYFLDCADLIMDSCKKMQLAKSYCKFIQEVWSPEDGCIQEIPDSIVPRSILFNIRAVYPMFRGAQQHDTQEFLRCFIDLIHEELKETPSSSPDVFFRKAQFLDEQSGNSDSSCQSEAEYETCDSGVSEPSAFFDDTLVSSPTDSYSPVDYKRLLSSLNNSTQEGQPKIEPKSIISDVFDGKLLSSVQCLTCDRISCKEEIFQDLSLPIPSKDHLALLHPTQGVISNNMNQFLQLIDGTSIYKYTYPQNWFWGMWSWLRSWFWGPSISLYDCLASFFSADELKGDNMYSCDKCNKLRNGVKYSRVLELPEILCVHLKRFRHDFSYSSKISSHVCFPLADLDMQPFMHKECKSSITTYNLVSVICHHGTVGGGHYTSFAKHEPSGKWYEFDDQYVTEVTTDTVQNCQAYVLFYRKNNPQMASIRMQVRELANSCSLENSDIRFFVSRQWIHRFNTFAEPGPIDNWSFLCPHGGLPPSRINLIDKVAVPLPQVIWEFLYEKYGGGPACNRLFECSVCARAAKLLSRRQKYELMVFSRLNDLFQSEDDKSTIYAISMVWLRQWQFFVRGVTNKEPGPINNLAIVSPSDGSVSRTVKPGSDYAQLNRNMWKFLLNTYGGGPEIVLVHGEDEIEPAPAQSIEVDPPTRNRRHSVTNSAKVANNDLNQIKSPPVFLPKEHEIDVTPIADDHETTVDDQSLKDDHEMLDNLDNSDVVSPNSLNNPSYASNVNKLKKRRSKSGKQFSQRKGKHSSELVKGKYSGKEVAGSSGVEGTYIQSSESSSFLNDPSTKTDGDFHQPKSEEEITLRLNDSSKKFASKYSNDGRTNGTHHPHSSSQRNARKKSKSKGDGRKAIVYSGDGSDTS